jgi:hypothetical protein
VKQKHKRTTPHFTGGINIAMKIPRAQYAATVRFYRNVLGLKLRKEQPGSKTISRSYSCRFGPNRLWLDRVDNYAQSSVWLELRTPKVKTSVTYLKKHGVTTCDEVEPLPAGFAGHWISNPAGIVHLVCE